MTACWVAYAIDLMSKMRWSEVCLINFVTSGDSLIQVHNIFRQVQLCIAELKIFRITSLCNDSCRGTTFNQVPPCRGASGRGIFVTPSAVGKINLELRAFARKAQTFFSTSDQSADIFLQHLQKSNVILSKSMQDSVLHPRQSQQLQTPTQQSCSQI
jgi:hypothetical protein